MFVDFNMLYTSVQDRHINIVKKSPHTTEDIVTLMLHQRCSIEKAMALDFSRQSKVNLLSLSLSLSLSLYLSLSLINTFSYHKHFLYHKHHFYTTNPFLISQTLFFLLNQVLLISYIYLSIGCDVSIFIGERGWIIV